MALTEQRQYTTHLDLDIIGDVVQVKEGHGPIQMIFCLKQENQQKINSHRWFFQAFGDFLRPKICVLLDAGTKPGSASIYHLWNAFKADDNCAGACGEIKTMLGRLGRNLWNPLVATQNFEYKMSNILDKPLESAFGFISVLPGAFSAYRYAALHITPGEKLNSRTEESPLDKYYKGEYMHIDSNDKPAGPINKFLGPVKNFFQENMYLAEDRILCYELVAKREKNWVLRYVQEATGETDVPEAVDKFISQRRRWLNGSFFAAVYSICHTFNLWRSGHSFIRKLMLTILVIYQIVSMIFAWYALVSSSTPVKSAYIVAKSTRRRTSSWYSVSSLARSEIPIS
jgi:chitin synthase